MLNVESLETATNDSNTVAKLMFELEVGSNESSNHCKSEIRKHLYSMGDEVYNTWISMHPIVKRLIRSDTVQSLEGVYSDSARMLLEAQLDIEVFSSINAELDELSTESLFPLSHIAKGFLKKDLVETKFDSLESERTYPRTIKEVLTEVDTRMTDFYENVEFNSELKESIYGNENMSLEEMSEVYREQRKLFHSIANGCRFLVVAEETCFGL